MNGPGMADGKVNIQSFKIVFNTTNSGDPCEMPHSPLFARVSKIQRVKRVQCRCS